MYIQVSWLNIHKHTYKYDIFELVSPAIPNQGTTLQLITHASGTCHRGMMLRPVISQIVAFWQLEQIQRCGVLKKIWATHHQSTLSLVKLYIYIYYIYTYDGLPKCLFLVLLINRNSLRAASYCAFKTMTDLNSLKPCILSFMFEAVAKTCSKC